MSRFNALVRRGVVGFGRFWWDFLVGDTPELFLAVVATIVVVSLISIAGHASAVAVVVLPVMVITALVISVRRATRP
ncbi:MAG TPA: hypothetical protein VNE22_02275 [Acidimicrobiales bacterium]|nr:hypothetical protein [Acidimicrobiales bacterium]